jgi:hypothetical protein
MPRYFFDIQDGHRLVDPSGKSFKNDNDAIARAKVYAIQVSLDTPKVDPERYIAVLNDARGEVSRVPVYSKPQAIF